MAEPAPSRDAIHEEMERARTQFHALVMNATPVELARISDGTRWTNRELIFHMLFGYLITRNLRLVLKLVTRLPNSAQRQFAQTLNSVTPPFHQINYWGSRAGGRAFSPACMAAWLDRVIASLHRHLDADTDAALRRSMTFPTRWDPYFGERMTLQAIYHYATQHFDHHRRQLTLTHPAS